MLVKDIVLSAPSAFQADLSALERLPNNALWSIALSMYSAVSTERLQELLEKNADDDVTDAEQRELAVLVEDANHFMLRKAAACALLRGRGHAMPPLAARQQLEELRQTAVVGDVLSPLAETWEVSQ